jgi:integrase
MLHWRRVQAFRGADSARIRYATEEQVQRLLNGCEGSFRKLVRGALETGCRYGELTKAHVADFHPAGPSLLIRDAKSGKSRHVPLDKQAAKFLSTITAGRAGNEYLFTRDEEEPWGTSHQARRLAEANGRAQIAPPINFHGLRHTWASLRIMRGLPLMVAAQVLGHSDTRMVEKHYGHLAKSYVSDAIEATTITLADEPKQNVVRMAR